MTAPATARPRRPPCPPWTDRDTHTNRNTHTDPEARHTPARHAESALDRTDAIGCGARLAGRAGRAGRDQRGVGDVAALIVLVPLALACVLLYVFFGNQGVANEAVTHASAAAARAASMQRDAGAGQAAAARAAAAALAEQDAACAGGPQVGVDAGRWAPGGVVVVTVTCTVEGIDAIGTGSRTFTASARATIDYFTGRPG